MKTFKDSIVIYLFLNLQAKVLEISPLNLLTTNLMLLTLPKDSSVSLAEKR